METHTANSDQNISLEVIANVARTMWLHMRMMTLSTIQHDKGSAEVGGNLRVYENDTIFFI
jgi:hypothetical protein